MARWPLWLKIILGLVGLVVGLVVFLFLGWALFPILGIVLAFSAAVRGRLVARLPAAGRLRPGVLGVIVAVAGLALWGAAISVLPKASTPTQTTVQPTTTAGPSPTVAVAVAQPTATSPATAVPTATTAPAPPTEAATQAPAVTAKPEPAPTEPAAPPAAAAAPPVPAYDLLKLETTSLLTRPRYRADVAMASDYTNDQTVAVLVDAVKKAFGEKRDAKAVVVFGYSSAAAAAQGTFDKGRAYASSDGLGWTGNRTFDTSRTGVRDEGKVYITLGSAIAGQSEAVAERDGTWTAVAAPAPPAPAPAAPAPAPKPATSGRAQPVGSSCPAGFPIKGNQGSRSTTEWIYHMPGGASYAATNPEECFATEADAQAAGYRRALR